MIIIKKKSNPFDFVKSSQCFKKKINKLLYSSHLCNRAKGLLKGFFINI
jgi:hypothetical protein